MIKEIIVIILGSLLTIPVYSQKGFYIQAATTYDFIPDLEKTERLSGVPFPAPVNGSIQENYKPAPGTEVGIGYQFKLFPKVSLLASSMLSFHKFTRTMRIILPVDRKSIVDTGLDSIGTDTPEDIGRTQILYFKIPLRVNMEIIPDRLVAGIGLSGSVLVFSRQKVLGTFFEDDLLYQDYYYDTSSDGLNNLILDCNLILQCRIFSGLWANVGYQHGISPIYDKGEQIAGKSNYRTIQLGLTYYLQNK